MINDDKHNTMVIWLELQVKYHQGDMIDMYPVACEPAWSLMSYQTIVFSTYIWQIPMEGKLVALTWWMVDTVVYSVFCFLCIMLTLFCFSQKQNTPPQCKVSINSSCYTDAYHFGFIFTQQSIYHIILNSLRLSDAYMPWQTNHHWFR